MFDGSWPNNIYNTIQGYCVIRLAIRESGGMGGVGGWGELGDGGGGGSWALH